MMGKKQKPGAVSAQPDVSVCICVRCKREYQLPKAVAADEITELTATICFDGQRECPCVGVLKGVPAKTYFISGPAPLHFARNEQGVVRVPDRTFVAGIPPDFYRSEHMDFSIDIARFTGGGVWFVDNRYETSSGLEQYWLDGKGLENPSYFCSEAEWKWFGWVSPEELHAAQRAADFAEVARLRAEVNELRKASQTMPKEGD